MAICLSSLTFVMTILKYILLAQYTMVVDVHVYSGYYIHVATVYNAIVVTLRFKLLTLIIQRKLFLSLRLLK